MNSRTPRSGKRDQTRQSGRRTGAIGVKRAYDKPSPDDGLRVLIDRLWPRGFSKSLFQYDAWPRALAPSNELRKWYGHDPQRFAEFRRRYRQELAPQREALAALRLKLKGRKATLLTATREIDLSHATVLRELLGQRGRT